LPWRRGKGNQKRRGKSISFRGGYRGKWWSALQKQKNKSTLFVSLGEFKNNVQRVARGSVNEMVTKNQKRKPKKRGVKDLAGFGTAVPGRGTGRKKRAQITVVSDEVLQMKRKAREETAGKIKK